MNSFKKKLIMKILKSMLFLMALSLIVFTACDGGKAKAEEAKEDMEESADQMEEAFRMGQQEMAEGLEEFGSDINEQISSLQSEMADATDERKTEINEQIAKLNAWAVRVDEQMVSLKETTKDGWEKAKSDMDSAMNEMKKDWKEMFNAE
jgi:thiamine biosynthesis lipoprotein ApbE